MAQLQRYFIGFSTQKSAETGVRTLYDIDLINEDLMAAFQTRVGERLLRPEYGCKLFNYLMEPLTPTMRDNIISEAIRICNLDQRCIMQSAQVYELDQGFRIEVVLMYLPWRVIGTFVADFQRDEQTYFNIG